MTGKWGLPDQMRIDRPIKLAMTGLLLASALALGGCSTPIADMPLGTPADAPVRARDAGSYLPVHDLPPQRDEAAMKPAEQAKIEAELIAARDRQAAASTPAKK